jgi:vancomycin aglycone glucosyltransferase
MCVPPDFREQIESLGIPVVPVGPELRKLTASSPPAAPGPLSPELRLQMAEGTVAAQFEAIAAAAQGCDLIVAATALQIAARSVAEGMRIPYVFAAYCPAVLPSLHHAPPPLPPLPGQAPASAAADNGELWAQDRERFNGLFGNALNTRRESRGLSAVVDVRDHIFTNRPWLAADPTLAPWPDPADQAVFQTGAWILPDLRPLSPELETFHRDRRSTGLLRLRQHSCAARPERRDDPVRARAWAPRDRVAGLGRAVARRRSTRLPVHRRGEPAGSLRARCSRRAPRRRRNHHRSRAWQVHLKSSSHSCTTNTTGHSAFTRSALERLTRPGAPTAESLAHALESTLQPDVAARAQSIATEMRRDERTHRRAVPGEGKTLEES